MAPAAVAGAMTERFDITTEEARVAIGQALRQWHALKLVGPHAANRTSISPPEIPFQPPPRGTVQDAKVHHYRVLDSSIALRCPPPYARIVEPTLAALSASPPMQEEALIEVIPIEDGCCEIRVDGAVVETCRGPEELVPTLKAVLLGVSLHESKDMAAFHAAGLARGDHCLLLPGASGRGKSTLSTALAMTGFALMSDDTMVLTEDTPLAARPLPFGACLKTGAWSALAGRAPQIMELPVHTRIDGLRVRYLLPPRLSLHKDADHPLPVRWIVFPHYLEGAALRMRPLSHTDALHRLMQGFCPLGAPLDKDKVALLVEWIAGVECHDLRYGDLDEAVALLHLLCT
jgi:hypothetical protein